MDGDFVEILIYLLIAVGGIIANVVRNVNKQKEAQRRPVPHEPEGFPDLGEEYVYGQEAEEEPHEVEFEHARPDETFAKPIEEFDQLGSITENDLSEEGDAVFAGTNEELLSDDLQKLGSSFSDDLKRVELRKEEASFYDLTKKKREKFNLRKAIIYSEIINRKYE